MGTRLVAAVFAVCLAASAQSLSVQKLADFLRNAANSQKFKYTDQEIAKYLHNVKLTEKLDDRAIEDIQGQITVGPKTLAALRLLRDQSQSLVAAKEVTAPLPPKPIPPPSSEEQAAILDDVRQYALGYSQNLPDFICTEVTRRLAAPAPGTRNGGRAGDSPHWQAVDTLTVRLSYFEQKEDYKLILHNSAPATNQDVRSVGGSQSFGDFGSMLKEIFEPSSEARFEWDHWGTLRGQRVMEFAYKIEQARSQYHLVVENNRSIITAYHGIVAVDPNTHVVLRVSVIAQDIPADFPVKNAEDILDYDYQDISGNTFLLPLKATVTASMGDYLSRNDKEFRIYRKYSADAVIKYDTEETSTPPPLDENKTKETTPAPAPPPAKKKQ
jgi:hypothetical protein